VSRTTGSPWLRRSPVSPHALQFGPIEPSAQSSPPGSSLSDEAGAQPLHLDVAAGHVAYEVKMTAALYAWTLKFDNEDPADVKNACLEATPLHVRLLIEFLAGRPSKDRRTTAAVAPASPSGEAGD